MIADLVARTFGSRAARRLARYRHVAQEIMALAPEHETLTPEALRDRVRELRQRAMAGAALDQLVIPMFALTREAARRAIGEQHVVAQLIGGQALQNGCVIEMKTGEGKTLAATLVCALNALAGRGVHVATPNDYLAERDANWMRPIYDVLGLSVGLVTQHVDDDTRRAAYACDVTYGIASEFGFDYLRDNMKFSAAETVQRGHAFALIDEVDSVLIDEASMPLALFGPLGDQSDFYRQVDSIVATLGPGDYDIDERRRVTLTDPGYETVQRMLRDTMLLKRSVSLHDIESISLLHNVVQALRAHTLLARDRDYIVQDGEVVIIDRFTGRMMHGRRYDDGLHQALEAKEGCVIGEETRTLASITFQAFFRQYEKLVGMTGTAIDDEEEYRQVYGLDVVVIPPQRPTIRRDESFLHSSGEDKFRAIMDEVETAKAREQPVLIGVPSIERSDAMAALLAARGWRQGESSNGKFFAVLNARHHADEARIIAQAGLPGAVTIATAMAGRGTDIRLGGPQGDARLRDKVIAAGGLLVIGAEHHEYSRLDAQLRGRAGRQGDPGRSVFHASLQDDLLATAGPIVIDGAQVDPTAARQLIGAAQKRGERRDFDKRLSSLRFDAVIQQQRRTIYGQRRAIRDNQDGLTLARDLRNDTIDDLLEQFTSSTTGWDAVGLDAAIRAILTLAVSVPESSGETGADASALRDTITAMADRWMEGKIRSIGRDHVNDIVRRLMMALIDQLWAEHTEKLEHLKRAIGDRRLVLHKGQAEFQSEAFALYAFMMKEFRHELTAHSMRLGVGRS
jgi:preprotein translocase subunit SecA